MKTKINTLALFALLLVTASSSASPILYDDVSTFQLQTGAVSAGALPNIGNAGNSFTVGRLTFLRESLSLFSGGFNWSTRIPGNDIAISGLEHFAVNIAPGTPVFSFGFDFHEPEFDPNVNGPFVDSEFTVTLFNGGSSGTIVDSFMFTRPNDALTFVGMQTSNPFDFIRIHETTGGIGNEFFGNFLFGTTPSSPQVVPVPAAVWLMGSGLLGLVGVARRKNVNFLTRT